jgi:hypothetical protein
MDLLLAGLGMLGCIAIMAVVVPLGMRIARRVRRNATTPTPDSTPPSSQDAPPIDHHSDGSDQAANAHNSREERG